ncbi:MAG: A24 family peptidase [Faecalibacterium sp.]
MIYIILIVFSVLCCAMAIAFFAFETEMKRKYDQEQTETLAAEQAQALAKPKRVLNLVNTSPRVRLIYMVVTCVVLLVLAVVRAHYFPDTPLSVNLKIIACVALLWPCAWIDVKTMRISNKMLLWGCIARVSILAAELVMQEDGFLYNIPQELIAMVAMLVVTLLCRLVMPGSIGFGDAKLMMIMALFLGSSCLWDAIFMSMIVAFFVAVFLMLSKRAGRQDVMPFAPFLMLGTTLMAFFVEV